MAIGIGYRVIRWAVGMPLWGDEVMYALSFPDRAFNEIFDPLINHQVAPPAYILYTWTVITQISTSELALRFLSMISGVLALVVFAMITRRWLAPWERLVAVAVLAVSYYTVRHGAELKPYALDLLVSTVILGLTLRLREDRSFGGRVAYLVVVPLAVLFSYPSLFMSAASLSVLFVGAALQRQWRFVRFLSLTGVVTLAVFLVVYQAVIAPHSDTNKGLFEIWQNGFPPGGLFANLAWFVEQSSGRTFSYPLGGKPYASILTFGLTLAGIACLARRRQGFLLAVLLAPFGFQLLAAFLGVYPYGMSQRISQHLAPSICMLMAVGVVGLAWRPRSSERPGYPAVALLSVCLVLGLGGIARTIYKPYKTEGVLQVRQFVDSLVSTHQCRPVHVINTPDTTPVNFLWYLRVNSDAYFGVDPASLTVRQENPLCVVLFDPARYPDRRNALNLALGGMRESREAVDEDRRIAYIYGGDSHPHHYRYHVLAKKEP